MDVKWMNEGVTRKNPKCADILKNKVALDDEVT
jgi:hypothetical protein